MRDRSSETPFPVVTVMPVINFTDTTREQAALNGDVRFLNRAQTDGSRASGSISIVDASRHNGPMRDTDRRAYSRARCIHKIYVGTHTMHIIGARGSRYSYVRLIPLFRSFFTSPWRSPIDLLKRDPSTFPSASISIHSTTCI